MPEHKEVDALARAAFAKSQNIRLALPVVPKKIDQRMVIQQSRFTIHGDNMALDDRLSSAEMQRVADRLMKFTIPKDCKESIHLGLFYMGVTRSTIFPDLATLAKEIHENAGILS